VAQFGGDPDRIVIHGASAGAGSVALHLTAYGGRDDGLFVGGIAESVFFPAQPYLSELEWQFDRVAQAVYCGTAADQMACLRETDVSELQAANVASPFPGRAGRPTPLFYWTPCVDGDLITDLPYALFQRGRFIRVPVLFGTDTDEGSVFATNAATPDDLDAFFRDNYPKLSGDDVAAILARYPLMAAVPNHEAWFPSASMAYGEATFICPAVNLLDAIARSWDAAAGPVFAYRYNVFDDEYASWGFGVPHLAEAGAVFGPDNVQGLAPQSYYSYNAPIVPVVMDYWISFVRALDPNPYRNVDAPAWEEWGPNRTRLLFELGNTRMEETSPQQQDRCDFWLSLSKVTEQKL
jgi:carboxylesterase type B